MPAEKLTEIMAKLDKDEVLVEKPASFVDVCKRAAPMRRKNGRAYDEHDEVVSAVWMHFFEGETLKGFYADHTDDFDIRHTVTDDGYQVVCLGFWPQSESEMELRRIEVQHFFLSALEGREFHISQSPDWCFGTAGKIVCIAFESLIVKPEPITETTPVVPAILLEDVKSESKENAAIVEPVVPVEEVNQVDSPAVAAARERFEATAPLTKAERRAARNQSA